MLLPAAKSLTAANNAQIPCFVRNLSQKFKPECRFPDRSRALRAATSRTLTFRNYAKGEPNSAKFRVVTVLIICAQSAQTRSGGIGVIDVIRRREYGT